MRTFYQFYLEQREAEQGFSLTDKQLKDLEYIRENLDFGAVSLTWYTVAVRLAIEMNNPKHKNYDSSYYFRIEVEAMLTAYLRAEYITAEEYCNYYDTFHRLMRANFRSTKPYRTKG